MLYVHLLFSRERKTIAQLTSVYESTQSKVAGSKRSIICLLLLVYTAIWDRVYSDFQVAQCFLLSVPFKYGITERICKIVLEILI